MNREQLQMKQKMYAEKIILIGHFIAAIPAGKDFSVTYTAQIDWTHLCFITLEGTEQKKSTVPA